MGDNAFFGGAAWARWLPPSMASVGEDELFSRCWELLVLDAQSVPPRRGAPAPLLF